MSTCYNMHATCNMHNFAGQSANQTDTLPVGLGHKNLSGINLWVSKLRVQGSLESSSVCGVCRAW